MDDKNWQEADNDDDDDDEEEVKAIAELFNKTGCAFGLPNRYRENRKR